MIIPPTKTSMTSDVEMNVITGVLPYDKPCLVRMNNTSYNFLDSPSHNRSKEALHLVKKLVYMSRIVLDLYTPLV